MADDKGVEINYKQFRALPIGSRVRVKRNTGSTVHGPSWQQGTLVTGGRSTTIRLTTCTMLAGGYWNLWDTDVITATFIYYAPTLKDLLTLLRTHEEKTIDLTAT